MGLNVVPVGETRLEEMQVRLEYTVEVDGAVCGKPDVPQHERAGAAGVGELGDVDAEVTDAANGLGWSGP